MIQQTVIKDLEKKTTKTNKPFLRVKIGDDSWVSCFESGTIEDIGRLVGKTVNMDIIDSKGFRNIKMVEEAENQSPQPMTGGLERTSYNASNNTTMYVSYAKDIFVSLISRISQTDFDANNTDFEALMQIATNSVNQAIKEISGKNV